MTGRRGDHRARLAHTIRPHGRQQLRQVLPLVTWVATLGVAIGLFSALGSGPLAAPPVTDPGTWGQWAAAREPVVATVAVLRLVVLALAWYLVGVTTVGTVARLARIAALVRVADALSVPLVRRVLQTSLGVGLATAVVAASAPGVVTRADAPATARPAAATEDATAADADGASAAPWMRPVPADPSPAGPSAGPTMRALDAPTPAPTMHALDPPTPTEDPSMAPLAGAAADTAPPPPGMRPLPTVEATTATTTATATTAPTTSPPADPPTPTRADDAPDTNPVHDDTWTVRAGDHLWAIAAAHLQATLDATPSDEVVADYWRRLVEANRGRLVDPDDPDLVVPGQRFVLPDVEVGR